MAIYKNKDIQANINERGVELGNINVNFYTEDNGTVSIRIKIRNQQGIPINFNNTDMQPRLDLYAKDGSVFTKEPLTTVLPEQGLIQYKVSDYVIRHKGKMDCKLFLTNGKESVHVANFYFIIQDSGVTGAVGKEIKVDILQDMVRNVMSENAMGLLDDAYKEKINQDVVEYISSNPDKYKGPPGDEGEKGNRGNPGAMGYKGERFKFEDFTKEQLDSLRTNIIPGEKETKIVDKGIEDSFIVYPPNGEDFRVYPNTIEDEYYHSSTVKNTTPTNSVNADSSFKIDSAGYLFYAVKAKGLLAPGNKFSIKVEMNNRENGLLLEYAILDSSGGYIKNITSLDQLSSNIFGLEEYVIPQGASAIQFRVDARQTSNTSSIKYFYLFEGKSTKEIVESTDEEVFKGILEDIDNLKYANANKEDEKFNISVFTPLKFTEKNHFLKNKIFTDGRGNFKAKIDMEDYKLSGGKTYYLDAIKGNNSNDGLSKKTPMKSFRDLMPKVSDNDTIVVAEGNYLRDRGILIAKPFNKSVNIIGENNNVNLIMADEPNWLKTSEKTNVYEFSRTATDRVIDITNDRELTKVESIDLVDATPNSWFTNGTIVYVNADNMPNENVIPVMSASNFQTTSLSSNIYFENINFKGGRNCVELNLDSSNSAFFNNCSFNYGASNYNGLNINGGKNIVLQNCTANNNGLDGLNYHIGSDGSKPFIVEMDCVGMNNGPEKGTAGVKSNNGTTIHDGLKGIRINGVYGRNDGGNVADVNEDTETWNLGCSAFESYQGKDFQTSSGSKMWLDNCIAYGSDNSINSADPNSEIYIRLGDYQNKLITGQEIKY